MRRAARDADVDDDDGDAYVTDGDGYDAEDDGDGRDEYLFSYCFLSSFSLCHHLWVSHCFWRCFFLQIVRSKFFPLQMCRLGSFQWLPRR